MKMKKIFSLAMAVVLAAGMTAGCKQQSDRREEKHFRKRPLCGEGNSPAGDGAGGDRNPE